MKLIGYVRVSTEDQARNGVSLADQEAKIRAYAELYGHEVTQVITDPGISAKNLRRPGVQCLLDSVKQKQTEGVVVAKLDRLTRSVRDLADIVELCGKRGVALVSVAEQIDTSTAAGRMVVNMLGVISQWERETIGERTSAAIQYKRANGESYPGRCAPYGYRKQDGRLAPVDSEQYVIAVVMDLSHTHGARAICRELQARGLRRRNGSTEWHHKIVGKIIADAEQRATIEVERMQEAA
ncbi:MAG: recombinase family protein [Chitinivibrionales bacterium]|nr:recombinase family protein [Chitinivibrionales bacterium]